MSDRSETATKSASAGQFGQPESERPTSIRRMVVAVTVGMAVILYLDRFCVSTSERYIKEDLGLSETQISWFTSVFFWAYALGQVPAGWFGDRAGIRWVLAGYILLWSLFTGFIGLATGVVMLLTMRVGCGIAQAGAFPLSGSLVRRWVPFQNRGFASGLVALGGRLGAVIAPLLTGYLMISFVPLSTPVQLDGRTILAPQALAKKLLPSKPDDKSGPPTPASHVWTLLTSADQETLREIATADPEIGSTPDSAQRVADVMNHILNSPKLFDEASMGRLSLSEEAVSFLKRDTLGGPPLTEVERPRFHRLILESAFRNEVGKLYVKGWRPVLFVYGFAGVAVAFLFWFVFRDWPAKQPWCNLAEQRLIAGVAENAALPADLPTATSKPTSTKLPILAILRSRGLMLSSISQFGTNVAWLFLLTSLPRYLIEVHDVPILKRSLMVSLPPLAGIAGMLLGGRLTDWLTGVIGLRWGRALPMGLTRFGIAIAYLACLWVESAWWAIAMVAAAFFFVDLGVGAVWAYMQDVGGRHVGPVLGWGNMWGNIGAAVANPLYNFVLGEHPTVRDWNNLFIVCAGMAVVSGVAGLAINANIPVEEPS
ncbi:MAG: MFS transporter [Planctomycetota bacterium]|nr:MFS transporter [Planctomycetota bacterium]